MTIRVRWGGATDIGQLRAVNQDAFDGTEWLCVVADGMGGHQGGEVAAAVATKTLVEGVQERSTEALVAGVNGANEAVLAAADDNAALAGMGTTVTTLAVVEGPNGPRIAIANVGDSRTYVYAGDELLQVTEDHSLVASLVRQGRLTAEQAAQHPQRNVVTRALGVEQRVLVDAWEVDPVAGDRYVLCTDGLTNELTDNQIAAVLRRLADPGEAAEELVRLANDHGGHDNITVVVVEVVEASGDATVPARGRIGAARRAITDAADAGTSVFAEVEPPPPTDQDHIAAIMERSAPSARREERDLRKLPQFSWRTLAFVGALLAVMAVVAVAILNEASGSYFVGADGDDVVVFKGKPGGTLVIDPEVVSRPGVALDLLTQIEQSRVLANPTFDSVEAAERFISELDRVVGGGSVDDGGAPDDAPSLAPSTTDEPNL